MGAGRPKARCHAGESPHLRAALQRENISRWRVWVHEVHHNARRCAWGGEGGEAEKERVHLSMYHGG